MTAAVKRRWFAFSLRTLFVAVTVFACWLGWAGHWVRQRHVLLARHQALAMETSSFRFNGIRSGQAGFFRGGLYIGGRPPEPEFPWSLRLLGQQPLAEVNLVFFRDRYEFEMSEEFTDDEIRTAEQLFPEATIYWRVYYSTPEFAGESALPR